MGSCKLTTPKIESKMKIFIYTLALATSLRCASLGHRGDEFKNFNYKLDGEACEKDSDCEQLCQDLWRKVYDKMQGERGFVEKTPEWVRDNGGRDDSMRIQYQLQYMTGFNSDGVKLELDPLEGIRIDVAVTSQKITNYYYNNYNYYNDDGTQEDQYLVVGLYPMVTIYETQLYYTEYFFVYAIIKQDSSIEIIKFKQIYPNVDAIAPTPENRYITFEDHDYYFQGHGHCTSNYSALSIEQQTILKPNDCKQLAIGVWSKVIESLKTEKKFKQWTGFATENQEIVLWKGNPEWSKLKGNKWENMLIFGEGLVNFENMPWHMGTCTHELCEVSGNVSVYLNSESESYNVFYVDALVREDDVEILQFTAKFEPFVAPGDEEFVLKNGGVNGAYDFRDPTWDPTWDLYSREY